MNQPIPTSPFAATCPSREQLLAFNDGRLSPPVDEWLAEHLADCPGCESTLEEIFEATTAGSTLRANFDTAVLHEPPLAELLAFAKGIAPQVEWTGDVDSDTTSLVADGSDSGDARLAMTPRVLVGDKATAATVAWNRGERLGKYELLQKVGGGGQGEVWMACHVHLDVLRAVKLPHKRPRPHDEFSRHSTSFNEQQLAARHFCEEAQKLANLGKEKLPNVVQVHDFDADLCMIVYEWIDGGNLAEHCQNRSLTWREAAAYTIEIAEALKNIHQHGIVHRDIKLSNILIAKNGELLLADFGLATYALEETGNASIAVGTLPYMALEQLQGQGANHRSDIYSLGVVFYELLTGRRPYWAKDRLHYIELQQQGAPQSIRDFQPEIPPQLEEICLRCLAADAAARPASAEEIAKVLRQLLKANDSQPDSLTEPTPAPPIGRRRRWIRAAALGAVVLAAVFAGVALYWNDGDSANGTGGTGAVGSPRIETEENLVAPAVVAAGNDPSDPRTSTPALANSPNFDWETDWQKRLGFRPKVMLWPGYGGLDRLRGVSDIRALEVSANYPLAIQLGELKGANARLSVGLSQMNWEGWTGIFLGYRLTTSNGRLCGRFQYIFFGTMVDEENGVRPVIRRRISEVSADGPPISSCIELGKEIVDWPKDMSFARLELDVTDRALVGARWAGKPLPGILGDWNDSQTGPQDYAGAWGVIVDSKVLTWIQDPSVTVLPIGATP